MQSINLDNSSQWVAVLLRYIVYVSLIRGFRAAIPLAQSIFNSKQVDIRTFIAANQKYWFIAAIAVAALVLLQQKIIGDDLLLLCAADLVTRCCDVKKEKVRRQISYGTGMACSFFEGYLVHVLPTDGAGFGGFQENIRTYESNEKVRFPVKRLFIIVTKSLYCPPDLSAFNKENRPDETTIEAQKSLEKVIKNVAGVKSRVYRNSAYAVRRRGAPPVPLAAECATPLHTLQRALRNRDLRAELEGIDTDQVVHDFTTALKNILTKSPECKNKCELVYFDDTDPNANLGDILLDRIREIEPKFEDIIRESALEINTYTS